MARATATATAPATAPAAPWLAELAGSPLPTRRQEDWRFTALEPLTAIAPQLAPSEGSSAWGELQLPAGVERLEGAAAEEQWLRLLQASGCGEQWPVALNRAAAQRAAEPLLALRVRGVVAEPLLLSLAASAAGGLRPAQLLLVLEPGASLELLQVITDDQEQPGLERPGLSVVTAVQLGGGARLKAGFLALGEAQACLLAHWAVLQEPASELQLTSAMGGWGLARFEPRIVQSQGAASTRLRGLQVCDGRQIADTHSAVRFDGPDGQLDQLHKVLADGHGRSVFNGAVKVPRLAQRTNAAQLSRSLLLSDRARVDTKPELEIVADDVKCAHGATVSRLRQEELFYLQSRGIAASQAATLLKRAFCEEVLRELPAAAAGWNPLERLLAEA
jgi:Fe-S cluster assembly protein SufD